MVRVYFVILFSFISKFAFATNIVGCRLGDNNSNYLIYYTASSPVSDGNQYNVTYFYRSTDKYATDYYNQAPIPCTIRNPQPYSTGAPDYGNCKVDFGGGVYQAGSRFSGELTPCQSTGPNNAPLDDYLPLAAVFFGLFFASYYRGNLFKVN